MQLSFVVVVSSPATLERMSGLTIAPQTLADILHTTQ
jgi:hypothetical protein